MKNFLLKTLTIIFAFTLILGIFTACGEPETPAHTHDYKTLKYDTENHWYECECGEKTNLVAHNLVNNTCVCGYEKIEQHVHDYKTLKYDTENHWYECECGEKQSVENHKGGTATCVNKAVCTVCNQDYGDYVHVFDNLKYDDNAHWYECVCGEKQSVENHKGGTATCTEKASCEVCKEKYGELGECNYVNKICAVCGAEQTSEGLVYKPIIIGGIDGWCVSGKGTCTDTEVVIANKYLNKPVLSIGDDAFGFCYSLTSIVIPNSVTRIGDRAFESCDSLTSIVIPNSVTSIGYYAFAYCDSLTSIVIPNSVTSIGEYAFYYCDSIEYNISDGLKYLGNSENQYLCLVGVVDSNITTATINNNCKVIGGGAFYECTSLTSIEIPNSVTSIGEYAFALCFSLTSIKVDENNANYKSIDGNLYSKDGKTLIQYANGKTATSFDIPNSVTSIGDMAFAVCISLTSIVIPNSVTSIGNRAFFWCESLTSIKVDENNANYKSIDGNLYSKDGKTLIRYANGKTATSFDIPNSVTSIGEYVFALCFSLTSIVIPNSVTSIGDYAFADCTSLTSIVIPNSVTSIGDMAFRDCYSLTSIEIPNSVTRIGDRAFESCDSLTSIVIPNSVTSIGDSAFGFCYSLTIYCKAESKPSGWSSSWNYSNRPVIWGGMKGIKQKNNTCAVAQVF